MPEPTRNSRYFGGIGLGTKESGVFVFRDGKCIKVSDRAPKIASRTLVNGEMVHCSPNGETLELDNRGPVRVQDATEKAAYLKETGSMPAPERRFGHWGGSTSKPKGGKRVLTKTFNQHFFEETGTSLKDHISSNYPDGCELSLDMNGGELPNA